MVEQAPFIEWLKNYEENIHLLEADIWARLSAAVASAKHPFHLPAIATINEKGFPSLRTVVLRNAVATQKSIYFHTDVRSPKWQNLQNNHALAALFYDASARLQLRIEGKALLHYQDAYCENAWQKTGVSSRRCYLATQAPSSAMSFPSSGLPDEMNDRNPTLDESSPGYNNFGVVEIKVQQIDWLWLNSKGHRRVIFTYSSDGNFQYNWLTP
ncbi:MAG: pyridoxamine 5'-phosphate oxidase family protein [Chitinophagaceae bacterium]